ncbi:MAG TPA: hypothetical protein VFE14_13230 [Micromonosporaceae bacterium]|nr:hypothetical protein [Micromonosporaceae bacterium]
MSVVTTVKRRRGLPRQEVALSERMRASGHTWVEIAAVVRERYGVNARVAMRKAHGWSQPDAADAWNLRWPAEPKTFKSFSSWETWPSPTGREPSYDVLVRLAELYECGLTDLLSDAPDFRDQDQALTARPLRERIPLPHILASGMDPVLDRLAEADIEEIAGVGLVWAERLRGTTPGIGYAVLQRLSAGLGLAAAAYAGMPPTEGEPVAEPRVDRYDSLAGIWRARGSRTPVEFFVVLREHRGRLLGQSLPQPTGARMRLDLHVDGTTVNGGWAEHPGYGWGTTSYGTVALTLEPSRRAMHGQWLGFGPDQRVSGGDWELVWADGSINGRTHTAHRMAA